MSPPDDEALFRFAQRPFSLTPDPKFYFRSRSHARVFDTLAAAIARRDSLLIVSGDLGVGKTTLCRTLMKSPECRSRSALLGHALLSPEELLRVMLQDLAAGEPRHGRFGHATRADLVQLFERFLGELHQADDRAVMIIDEAHCLPPATMEQIVEIASLDANRDRVLQFLLAGQPTAGGVTLPSLGDTRLTVRARLLPLERDECERYVHHRLTIAGGAVTFSAAALAMVHSLSGGVPRRINLLCERALQEAASAHAGGVEEAMIEAAASALGLLRIRPKRFRWYGLSYTPTHVLRAGVGRN